MAISNRSECDLSRKIALLAKRLSSLKVRTFAGESEVNAISAPEVAAEKNTNKIIRSKFPSIMCA
jgi:hypothetical protein